MIVNLRIWKIKGHDDIPAFFSILTSD